MIPVSALWVHPAIVERERQAKWDRRFLEQAQTIAQWSKDQSTKVGCVIVGPNREIRSTGYNGFARGVDDTIQERFDRPFKYVWTVHAEQNALFHAARVGVPTEGCTAYVHAGALVGPPCAECARGLIQSGISRVVCNGSAAPADWREDWRKSMLVSVEMFNEAGVLFEGVS